MDVFHKALGIHMCLDDGSEVSPNILSWKCQVLKVMSLINSCSSPRSCGSVVYLLRYILLSRICLLDTARAVDSQDTAAHGCQRF